MLRFEWDREKGKRNIRKHGVSFEEAATAFRDSSAKLIHDPDHASEEDRFVLLGMSQKLRILVVCHCYRKSEEVIRIISARKAAKKEEKFYMEDLL